MKTRASFRFLLFFLLCANALLFDSAAITSIHAAKNFFAASTRSNISTFERQPSMGNFGCAVQLSPAQQCQPVLLGVLMTAPEQGQFLWFSYSVFGNISLPSLSSSSSSQTKKSVFDGSNSSSCSQCMVVQAMPVGQVGGECPTAPRRYLLPGQCVNPPVSVTLNSPSTSEAVMVVSSSTDAILVIANKTSYIFPVQDLQVSIPISVGGNYSSSQRREEEEKYLMSLIRGEEGFQISSGPEFLPNGETNNSLVGIIALTNRNGNATLLFRVSFFVFTQNSSSSTSSSVNVLLEPILKSCSSTSSTTITSSSNNQTLAFQFPGQATMIIAATNSPRAAVRLGSGNATFFVFLDVSSSVSAACETEAIFLTNQQSPVMIPKHHYGFTSNGQFFFFLTPQNESSHGNNGDEIDVLLSSVEIVPIRFASPDAPTNARTSHNNNNSNSPDMMVIPNTSVIKSSHEGIGGIVVTQVTAVASPFAPLILSRASLVGLFTLPVLTSSNSEKAAIYLTECTPLSNSSSTTNSNLLGFSAALVEILVPSSLHSPPNSEVNNSNLGRLSSSDSSTPTTAATKLVLPARNSNEQPLPLDRFQLPGNSCPTALTVTRRYMASSSSTASTYYIGFDDGRIERVHHHGNSGATTGTEGATNNRPPWMQFEIFLGLLGALLLVAVGYVFSGKRKNTMEAQKLFVDPFIPPKSAGSSHVGPGNTTTLFEETYPSRSVFGSTTAYNSGVWNSSVVAANTPHPSSPQPPRPQVKPGPKPDLSAQHYLERRCLEGDEERRRKLFEAVESTSHGSILTRMAYERPKLPAIIGPILDLPHDGDLDDPETKRKYINFYLNFKSFLLQQQQPQDLELFLSWLQQDRTHSVSKKFQALLQFKPITNDDGNSVTSALSPSFYHGLFENHPLFIKMTSMSARELKVYQCLLKQPEEQLRPLLLPHFFLLTENDRIALVMERGELSLADYIEDRDTDPLSPFGNARDSFEFELEESVFKALLAAFSVLHDHEIIHRDCKPSNIMRCKDGLIKLGDFSLAAIVTTDNGHSSGAGNICSRQSSSVALGTPNTSTRSLSLGAGSTSFRGTHHHNTNNNAHPQSTITFSRPAQSFNPLEDFRLQPGTERHLPLEDRFFAPSSTLQHHHDDPFHKEVYSIGTCMAEILYRNDIWAPFRFAVHDNMAIKLLLAKCLDPTYRPSVKELKAWDQHVRESFPERFPFVDVADSFWTTLDEFAYHLHRGDPGLLRELLNEDLGEAQDNGNQPAAAAPNKKNYQSPQNQSFGKLLYARLSHCISATALKRAALLLLDQYFQEPESAEADNSWMMWFSLGFLLQVLALEHLQDSDPVDDLTQQQTLSKYKKLQSKLQQQRAASIRKLVKNEESKSSDLNDDANDDDPGCSTLSFIHLLNKKLTEFIQNKADREDINSFFEYHLMERILPQLFRCVASTVMKRNESNMSAYFVMRSLAIPACRDAENETAHNFSNNEQLCWAISLASVTVNHFNSLFASTTPRCASSSSSTLSAFASDGSSSPILPPSPTRGAHQAPLIRTSTLVAALRHCVAEGPHHVSFQPHLTSHLGLNLTMAIRNETLKKHLETALEQGLQRSLPQQHPYRYRVTIEEERNLDRAAERIGRGQHGTLGLAAVVLDFNSGERVGREASVFTLDDVRNWVEQKRQGQQQQLIGHCVTICNGRVIPRGNRTKAHRWVVKNADPTAGGYVAAQSGSADTLEGLVSAIYDQKAVFAPPSRQEEFQKAIDEKMMCLFFVNVVGTKR